MGDGPGELGGAFRPGAAQGGPVLVPQDSGPADGTGFRQAVGLRVLGTLLQDHAQYLRDDLPRFADAQGIPDADILFRDEILVVEGGVHHRGARQAHRVEDRLGGKHPRSSHLHHDLPQHAFLHFRRIFIGDGPSGGFAGAAQISPI